MNNNNPPTRWHLGSMNDGLFIIDTPPRPSTDDVWHDRPDGPTMVLNVGGLPPYKAQEIVDAHNEALGLTPLPTATAVEQWGWVVNTTGRIETGRDDTHARELTLQYPEYYTLARLVAVDPATLPAGTRVLVLADEAGVALGVRE